MRLFKSVLMYVIWDIAFYVMVSIMIIAKNYAYDKYIQTSILQYQYMYMGLHILLWFLVGAFLVFLINFKRSSGSKNNKLIEMIVVCVPAVFLTGLYFFYHFLPIKTSAFLVNNMDLMMSFGALILGCEIFGVFFKRKGKY